MQHALKFFREEDGLAVTEYGLLLTLIAVAVVTVVSQFGDALKAAFTKATQEITPP